MEDEKCNAIRIAFKNIGGLGPSFAYLSLSTAASSTQCMCAQNRTVLLGPGARWGINGSK